MNKEHYLQQFINEMTYCLKHPKEYAKGYEKEIFWKYKATLEDIANQQLINSNPGEALECLERIGKGHTYYDGERISTEYEEEFDTIKQALIQAENDKDTIRELVEKLRENEELKKIDEEWEDE